MRDARSLRDAFASTSGFRARGVATADVFTVAQEWLRNHNYVEYLRASALLSPSSDRMDADATPFDAVLRAATGAAPNLVNQDALGDWAEEFAVCHNDVEFDRRWNDLTSGNTGALAGPDRQVGGLPGHVVVTTRDAVWGKSNVGALALSGSEEEKREAVKFLLRMHLKEAKKDFGAISAKRGWITNSDLHVAVYEFENIKIAQKILKSKKLKLLIQKFDNKWNSKVNRTREIVDIIQEY